MTSDATTRTDLTEAIHNEIGLSNRPEAANVVGSYSSLSDQNLSNTINEFSGKNFSEFKKKLASLIVDRISPISFEINKLLNDQLFIDKVLKDGAEKADAIASKKIENLKKIVGF